MNISNRTVILTALVAAITLFLLWLFVFRDKPAETKDKGGNGNGGNNGSQDPYIESDIDKIATAWKQPTRVFNKDFTLYKEYNKGQVIGKIVGDYFSSIDFLGFFVVNVDGKEKYVAKVEVNW